jgi:splicing factor U2AF subunit
MNDESELAECLEDIKEECGSFGTLLSCEVPTKTALLGYAEADVGKCFVTYELISSAVKAHTALNGRSFDGNTVRATFLPPPEPKPEQGQPAPETTG